MTTVKDFMDLLAKLPPETPVLKDCGEAYREPQTWRLKTRVLFQDRGGFHDTNNIGGVEIPVLCLIWEV